MAEKERVDRQKEAILARRRAALADLTSRPQPSPAPPVEVPVEPSRQMWDTGPIRDLARSAAARTVRTVWRRPEDRVPTSV
jgi:hypothetical protein